eukprot:SAG11_NODE_34485_length_271_cov_1.802326_1_plen_36_part_01
MPNAANQVIDEASGEAHSSVIDDAMAGYDAYWATAV